MARPSAGVARRRRARRWPVLPADGIEAKREFLPAGAYLAITCSPRRGIEVTLDLAERLSKQRRLRLVPQVSSRLVVDERHPAEIWLASKSSRRTASLRRRYRPDDLLMRLADHEDAPIQDAAGFHLYSFDQVEETERWRASMPERLAER